MIRELITGNDPQILESLEKQLDLWMKEIDQVSIQAMWLSKTLKVGKDFDVLIKWTAFGIEFSSNNIKMSPGRGKRLTDPSIGFLNWIFREIVLLKERGLLKSS